MEFSRAAANLFQSYPNRKRKTQTGGWREFAENSKPGKSTTHFDVGRKVGADHSELGGRPCTEVPTPQSQHQAVGKQCLKLREEIN